MHARSCLAFPLMLLGAVLLASGCASSAPALLAGIEDLDQAEQSIREVEDRWHGTPFLLGSRSSDGIDCSNFVSQVYEEAFGVRIPATTLELLDLGTPVEQRSLQAGDLVFFQPPGAARHVGVYLGGGEFAHASTSRGVMISRLEENYWTRAYWTARRLVAEDAEETVEPVPVTRVQPAPGRRVGW